MIKNIGGGQFVVNGRPVRTDWEYPVAAEQVGWTIRRVQKRGRDTRFLSVARKGKHNCRHSHTDGTIDCPDCGVKAIAFIEAAGMYLRERAG
jgi:hypothetical protein